jgi:hypothetical protein
MLRKLKKDANTVGKKFKNSLKRLDKTRYMYGKGSWMLQKLNGKGINLFCDVRVSI